MRTPQNNPKISDRMSAGFIGGGGIWLIEVVFNEGHSDYWVAKWEVWNKDAPDKRVWKVTYVLADQRAAENSSAPDLILLKQHFLQVLQTIRAFSARENCNSFFTNSFDHALETISSNDMKLQMKYHRDLSPEGFLQRDATILLDAAQTSYVFGGMGTWNDLGFSKEVQKEYDQVSEDFFETLNEVIIATTNMSYYSNLRVK